ncbi:MAG: hypothetical protein ACRYFU_12830 [Janthinobacterium lividum]
MENTTVAERQPIAAQFSLLPDQQPLARKLTFRDKERILELARRTGASDEVMAELERTLRAWGQGSVTLSLTEAQVRALGGVCG